MSDREKQILKILRRNPLIQQNEVADTLQISRSYVVAHTMDLMYKGLIKGRGYILTEQDYHVAVGAINMDIRGIADIRHLQATFHPGSVHCSAGGVGHNIAHNPALFGRDAHPILAIGNDFYDETLLEETRRAGVNVSNCIRLRGHNTTTYLAIANKQEETILAISDTHILQQLTPQLLSTLRDLIRHAGVVLANCNLTPEAPEWVFIIADEIPMFIDTASEFKANRVRNWYSRIHTLKPTQSELEILRERLTKDDNNHIGVVSSLHQQSVKRIFVYLKNESVFCSDKDGGRSLLTAPTHTTVDNFDADDGFMAGLIHSFFGGHSFRDSTRFAMVCTTVSHASDSLNDPTLSVDNAPSLAPMA